MPLPPAKVRAKLNTTWREAKSDDSLDSVYGEALNKTLSEVEADDRPWVLNEHVEAKALDIAADLFPGLNLESNVILLDHGGFGFAFRVQGNGLGDSVLKLLNPEKYTDQNINRFKQEAELLRCVGFEATVPIHQSGVYKKQHYIHMGYGGQPLYDSRKKDCANLDRLRESPRHFLAFVEGVVQALQHCHEKSIVHRDLKPSNIVIGADEFRRVRLIDFGASRKTGDDDRITKTDGKVPHTRRYCDHQAAPEDNEKKYYDAFSLGRVFQMVLRCHPDDEENEPGRDLDPSFEPILADLKRILETAVAPLGTQRPSPVQLLEFLRAVCDPPVVRLAPDPPVLKPRPVAVAGPQTFLDVVRRHRTAILGVAASLCIVGLLAGFFAASQRKVHELRIASLRSEAIALAFHSRTGHVAETHEVERRLREHLERIDESRLSGADKLVVAEVYLLLAIQDNEQDIPRSLVEYQKCIDLLKPLHDARAFTGAEMRKCRETLGRAFGCRGDRYLVQEKHEEAKADYDESSELRHKAVKEGSTPYSLIQLGRSYSNLARLAHARNDLVEARRNWSDALTQFQNALSVLNGKQDDVEATHIFEGDLTVVAKRNFAFSVLDYQNGYAVCLQKHDKEFVRIVSIATDYISEIQHTPGIQNEIRELKLCYYLIEPSLPLSNRKDFFTPETLAVEIQRLEKEKRTPWTSELLGQLKKRSA